MAGPWAVAVTLGGGAPLGVQDGCGGLHLTPECLRSRVFPWWSRPPPRLAPAVAPGVSQGPRPPPMLPRLCAPSPLPPGGLCAATPSSPWNRPPPSPSLGPGPLQAPRAVVSGREPWSVGLALGFPLPPVQLLRFALRLRGPSISPSAPSVGGSPGRGAFLFHGPQEWVPSSLPSCLFSFCSAQLRGGFSCPLWSLRSSANAQ